MLMLVWLGGVASLFFRRSPLPRGILVWLVGAVAVAWTGFILDKILVELSPHWAQKPSSPPTTTSARGPRSR